MNSSTTMTIIGAGLVGSLLAVLLRRRGFNVVVYEKRPDLRKARVGGGRSINLVITSRGLYGLEQAGVLEAARKLTVPVYGRMIHARSGEQTYQPYGRENECNLSVSRSDLNRFLIETAEANGVKFYFDHELRDVDLENRKLVFDTPEGSVHVAYTRLFGTDGAGSCVRESLLRQKPNIYLENIEWLEADYVELLMPAVSAPSEKPQWPMKAQALHIWPRGAHMLMGLANPDGSFTMTLYLPKEGPVSFKAIQSKEDVKRFFAADFKDAIPLMPRFAEEYLSHPRGKLGTVRFTKWNWRDSVLLLGDAAHAIVPFFGQGMNCGAEDCTELVRLMDEREITATSSPDAWETLFNDFDEIRRPNANAIADMALENWVEMRDRVGDERFLLRKKVEALLEETFPNLFKPRYGLITYTRVPYRQAQEVGRIHDKILGVLCEGITRPEEVDLETAETLLRHELKAFHSP